VNRPAQFLAVLINGLGVSFSLTPAATTNTATTNAPSLSKPIDRDAADKQRNEWYEHIEAEAKVGRGKAQVPDLIKILDDPNDDRKELTTQLLALIGNQAVDAVPALLRHIDDPDFMVRLRSVQALGDVGPEAAPAIPDLIRLLRDPEWLIVHSAIQSLGGIGPKASAALPQIQQVLLLPKSTQRYADLIVDARVAIAKITQKPGVQVLALLPMLEQKNDDSIDSFPRTVAMNGLVALWPASKQALPRIGEILLDQTMDSNTRTDAARALQSFNDPSAVPYLQKAVQNDPDVLVRNWAIEALKHIEGPTFDDATLRKQSWAKESTDLVKRMQPFNDKLKPLTSDLPKVTTVEVDRLQAYMAGEKDQPQPPPGAPLFPMNPDGYTLVVTGKVTLSGADAEKLADEWRHLDFGVQYQALCHFPIYGLKFVSGNQVLFQTTICWHCSDFSLSDGGYGGFNSSAESSNILKKHLETLLPPIKK
jgi:hypothetical protein